MKIYRIYTLHWEGTDVVYVGMTTNPKDRFRRHCREWTVCPSHLEVEASYIYITEARLAEARWIEHFVRAGLSLNIRTLDSCLVARSNIDRESLCNANFLNIRKIAYPNASILAFSNVLENGENVAGWEANLRGGGRRGHPGVGTGSALVEADLLSSQQLSEQEDVRYIGGLYRVHVY